MGKLNFFTVRIADFFWNLSRAKQWLLSALEDMKLSSLLLNFRFQFHTSKFNSPPRVWSWATPETLNTRELVEISKYSKLQTSHWWKIFLKYDDRKIQKKIKIFNYLRKSLRCSFNFFVSQDSSERNQISSVVWLDSFTGPSSFSSSEDFSYYFQFSRIFIIIDFGSGEKYVKRISLYLHLENSDCVLEIHFSRKLKI